MHLYKKLKSEDAATSGSSTPSATEPRTEYRVAVENQSLLTSHRELGSFDRSKGERGSQTRSTSHDAPLTSPSLSPLLWGSKEFLFYYVCVFIALVCMAWEAYYISTEEHPNFKRYAYRLQQGWLFGRKVDNSDLQFGMFRNNYRLLIATMTGYLVLSHLVHRLFAQNTPPTQPLRPLYRAYFFLAFSLCFLAFLFGASVLKIITIVSANYAIARALGGSRWSPAVTWTFNLVVLVANEVYHGYRFRDLDVRLAGMDVYNGIARWYVFFNITMLRIVSFNMDYYWSHRVSNDTVEGPLTEKIRIMRPCRKADYNYLYYMAYLLYAPLYLAGPIVTYNSFISQLRHPPRQITGKGTLMYGARLLVCIIVMEFVLHHFYVVAISKEKAWVGYTPFQISVVGYWNLKIIWLKLLIIWRFFRFWAMADGIDAPENMVRCMSNNYSAQGFWRGWHRSYNRWLVRYIYVPLGGSKYAKYNIWIIFTFVALWHDLSMNLFAWSWLICLFIMPEMLCTAYFGRPKFRRWKYYRQIAAFGGVLNIILMMAANLVGFAVGVDGIKDMTSQILNLNGAAWIVCTVITLFSAVQIMFEIRESEKRAATGLRC